jgi:hypothetical protein
MLLQLRSAPGKEQVMRHFHVWIAFFITVGFFSFNPQSQAALSDPLTTIELDTPVHFLAPDGSDLVVEAGTYAIEPAKEWIRLMSGERHDALLIEAKQGSHELDIEDPLALSIPGTAGGQADNHYVMLLLPGGQSLEATGTYSGIRPRGLFDQAVKGFNRAKRDANRAYRQARSTVKKTQRSVQKGMSRAQKDMQRAQRQAAAKAEKNIRAARRAALQAKNQVERAAKQMADTATCLFANNKEARGLKVGGTVTVRIFAKKMCNDTKIMVLTGHKYSFEANGKWTDLDNTCDADGYPSPNTLLRASEGLRRMPGANWFALICAVNADKKLLFPIGTRRTMSMPRSGRLACFANDVATMYGNNKGEVKLTVTRVD